MRIQFYAPHPDDIEIFCGGTFLRHYRWRHELQVLLMSRGGAGTINPRRRGALMEAIRTRETEERLRLVPGVACLWLEFRDGEIRYSDAAVATVREKMAAFRPEIIYLPESERWLSYYRHPDHLHTGRIVEEAARSLASRAALRHYHSRFPNRFVDIDAVFEASQTALRCYVSQYSVQAFPPFLMRFLEFLREFRLKKSGREIQCAYAERFREVAATLPTGKHKEALSAISQKPF